MRTRYSLLGLSLLMTACAQATAPNTNEPNAITSKQQALAKDVAAFCDIVKTNYYYYPSRADTWPEACETARSAVTSTDTPSERLSVLEGLVDALYDPHVSLNTNSSTSPRLVPSGTDYYLNSINVTAVRKGSGAAEAGLAVGSLVTEINGVETAKASKTRMVPLASRPSTEQSEWAIQAAIAGYRGAARTLTAAIPSPMADSQTLTLKGPEPNAPTAPLTFRQLEDDIAYVRLNNSLGNMETVTAFNAAAEVMKESSAWILDLRDTPGGGGTDIAEPIMGRFITETQPYQKIIPKDEPAWTKTVSPADDWTIDAPLVVLVGRWTGSMGEGMAIGFDGMGRGHVMGTEMARLAGGVETFTLPATGIGVNIPTYDLAHLDGTPRHTWTPPHITVADNGNGPDIALDQAIEWLLTKTDAE